MSKINDTLAKPDSYRVEFVQIGWVIPDIHAAVKFLTNALGIHGFPPPEHIQAQDLDMTYHGKVVAATG